MRISALSIGQLQKSELSSLIRQIGADSFDSSRSSGFLVCSQTSERIEASYVHKVTGVLKITDPFGTPLEFPRVTFFEQRFRLQLKPPQLVLFDPGQGWQPLLGRLLEFSNFRISAEPIQMSLQSLVSGLSAEFENVRVYGANLNALSVNDQTTARISFESSSDARQEAKAFLKNHRCDFSALKCEFEYGGRIRRCELRPSGSITFYGESDPMLEAAITRMLSRMCAES